MNSVTEQKTLWGLTEWIQEQKRAPPTAVGIVCAPCAMRNWRPMSYFHCPLAEDRYFTLCPFLFAAGAPPSGVSWIQFNKWEPSGVKPNDHINESGNKFPLVHDLSVLSEDNWIRRKASSFLPVSSFSKTLLVSSGLWKTDASLLRMLCAHSHWTCERRGTREDEARQIQTVRTSGVHGPTSHTQKAGVFGSSRNGRMLWIHGGQREPADQRGDRETAAEGQEGFAPGAEAAAVRWASPEHCEWQVWVRGDVGGFAGGMGQPEVSVASTHTKGSNLTEVSFHVVRYRASAWIEIFRIHTWTLFW